MSSLAQISPPKMYARLFSILGDALKAFPKHEDVQVEVKTALVGIQRGNFEEPRMTQHGAL